MKTIEEVRKVFEKDRFATENGMIIEEIGERYAKCSVKLGERHQNAVGSVMGGVPFTLADFAFAVATNWEKPGIVSLSSNITFLSKAKGDVLIAEAHCIKDGRSTNYYKVDVTDNLGTLVAVVTITGFNTAK